MAGTARLVWLRRDLRIADHEGLSLSDERGPTVIPFFAFDPRKLRGAHSSRPPDLPQVGPYRARFMLAAVRDLAGKLETLGAGLVFRVESPLSTVVSLLPCLARCFDHIDLVYSVDYGAGFEEEAASVEQAFVASVESAGLTNSVRRIWDRTLVHPEDLPLQWASTSEIRSLDAGLGVAGKLAEAPKVMTSFRKVLEAEGRVRPPKEAPQRLPPIPAAILETSQQIPGSLEALYNAAGAGPPFQEVARWMGREAADSVEVEDSEFPFSGGETEAHARLEHICSPRQPGTTGQEAFLRSFKERRMLATGLDNSSKLSAFLNLGCISPRQVYAALQEVAGPDMAEGRDMLIMHLQIRDYFQFSYLRKLADPQSSREEASDNLVAEGEPPPEFVRRWCQGQTGFPFVDAGMRELVSTGYMSNRSRQNAASLLTKSLGVDWRMGEAFFRFMLVDYDPAANIGNWQYVAGRGTFRTVSQGLKYDESAALIRRWLPELRELPTEEAHKPWLSKRDLSPYPSPILDPASQLRKEDQ